MKRTAETHLDYINDRLTRRDALGTARNAAVMDVMSCDRSPSSYVKGKKGRRRRRRFQSFYLI